MKIKVLLSIVVIFLLPGTTSFAQQLQPSVCDRTKAIKSALQKKVGKACANIILEDLEKIQVLEISGKIKSLRVGDFQGLTYLREMSIF